MRITITATTALQKLFLQMLLDSSIETTRVVNTLATDKGTEFMSVTTTEVCKLLNSTAYHHV